MTESGAALTILRQLAKGRQAFAPDERLHVSVVG